MPYEFDYSEFKRKKLEDKDEAYDYYCKCDYEGILELYTDEELREHSNFLKVLGNPLRLQILKILSHVDMCVCAISEILGQQQTLVSHHLSKLKSARIVEERQNGKYRIYSIKDKRVKQILAVLADGS
ncbi:ArsR/SmtB family transcription factor [Geoglobus acetivorans]|uniref:Cadmium efflux system accessory protein n=1 Tax=Geoglobus acetivorans TaxID=565033 RepID=A0A0A7GCC3_GEOAI|nr:Cadmium efflux system accessory protein [Geoglobus acetivorans]